MPRGSAGTSAGRNWPASKKAGVITNDEERRGALVEGTVLSTLSISADKQRFTLDGSEALEQQLECLCRQVGRTALELVGPAKLEALVLGGGYGRGQGGVLQTEDGQAPYNDLEFYVFLRGNYWANVRKFRPLFHQLETNLSPTAGLHVEFKVDSLPKLRQAPVSIFTYDLVSGHRLIFGRNSIFDDCQRHADAANIPASEATRLLLNRGTGLLLAKELLRQGSLTVEESDFVGRNLAKARLALGDALLAFDGRYHWDCLERARRLRSLRRPGLEMLLPRVLEHHSAGVRFKLHPWREQKELEQFRAEHRELTRLALEVWLWIENQRLAGGCVDFRQYSCSDLDKCNAGGFWRNLALNLKAFGPRAALDPNSRRYPRQRLLNTLPLLLQDEPGTNPWNMKGHLQSQLRTAAQDWPGFVSAYKRLWSCYG